MGRELQNSEQGERKKQSKFKGELVDDVDGGGVLEGGSVMGMGTEIRRGGMWYSGGSYKTARKGKKGRSCSGLGLGY